MNASFLLSFLNVPAMVSVILISLLTLGVAKKNGKTFSHLNGLILPLNLFVCSIYSVYALLNLADASSIGPWLSFVFVSIFWASSIQIILLLISAKIEARK